MRQKLFELFNPADKRMDWKKADVLAARRVCKELTRWNHPGIVGLNPEGRDMIGQVLADSINSVYPKSKTSSESRMRAEKLKEDGCVPLDRLLDPAKVLQAREYFELNKCYNSHVYGEVYGDGVGRDPKNDARAFRFGSYPQNVALLAPHLLEVLVSDPVLDVAELYLGARPMLFSVNTFWSFPQKGEASYGQDYHRDISHSRLCVLFIYLTDTDTKTGAHQYICKTHTPAMAEKYLKQKGISKSSQDFFNLPMDGLGFTELYEKHFSEQVVTLAGNSGSAFMEDGYGLHRGLPPLNQPRLVCWARYTLFTEAPDLPKMNRRLLGGRYPDAERARYALRGVVA